jgi:spermidine synthase
MFVLSGAASLVFEVALQRALTRAFGVSAVATSIVLAAWMAGLALGALLFGRLADRVRAPLRLYAWLELGIGACAAMMPFLIPWAIDGYTAVARGRSIDDVGVRLGLFLVAFGITLLPTVLMGGTLPPVGRALGATSALASGVSEMARLYAANTLGAALGAGMGAYVILPTLGLSASMRAAAVMNLAAALVGFWLSPRLGNVEAARPVETTRAPLSLVALSFWSGAATFVAEVTWFHLLGAVIGSSAYAFGLMLALLLAALTLGAAWVSRQVESKVDLRVVGTVQAVAAVALVATLPLWDKSSALFVVAGRFVQGFAAKESIRALVATQLILIPAAVLGTVFPLILRFGVRAGRVGQSIGGIAAANTAGAIGGSLLTGFVILPLLGSRGTLLLLIFGCAGVAVSLAHRRLKIVGAIAAFGALMVPSWNWASLASGANVYFSETPYYHSHLEWAKESVRSGITSVVRHPKSKKVTLLTNGKFQGNESGEVDAQLAYAQIPLLALRRFERALLIGVGTGCSLSALAAQPFQAIDAVELSEDIVEGARRYFGSVNEGVFEPTSRVRVHIADGRNFLLLSLAQYDLITLQLSSIWFAGAADLYNRDFYALAKKRLSAEGVIQQWVQLHHLTRRDLAIIIGSMKAEFPHVMLFFRGNQGILIGSVAPFLFDRTVVMQRSAQLAGTAATRGVPGSDLLVLTGSLLLDEVGIDAFLAEEAQAWRRHSSELVSTDDNLLLEYSTPKSNADDSLLQDVFVESIRHLRPSTFPLQGLETESDRLHAEVAFLIGKGELDEARARLPTPVPSSLNSLATWLSARR